MAGSAACGEPSASEGTGAPGRPGRGGGPTLPSVPCAAMPRKQRRLAAAGDRKLLEGVMPQERTRVLCEAMIRRKLERCAGTRCSKCWFPLNSSGTSYCICAQLPPLRFRTGARFLLYMHPRDWYNAGDDAKIFLNAASSETELFLFGRPGDDQRLRAALAAAGPAALVLFPDEAALSAAVFLERWRTAAASGAAAGDGPCGTLPSAPSIVVVDGTWNNVKQMMKHLRREISPETPHVRLQPTELSVYARTQTRADGISSVEAVALLLRLFGEEPETCDELVRYITVNNEALRLHRPCVDDESASNADE